MNRRWMICNDVWMDMFPFFDRPQLGLKLALLSPRFNALVDKHFDGQSELPIWNDITIRKGIGPKAILRLSMEHIFVDLQLPKCPLPDKIRFEGLKIYYIDCSVIAFLRSNKHLFDKGTNLLLCVPNQMPIWDVLAREILPVFMPHICHLYFNDAGHLQKLRRFISPTILTDLKQLNSVASAGGLFPALFHGDFDGPNAISSGQALAKWLHMPRSDGQPKGLCCVHFKESKARKWLNKFKEEFLRSTTSANYIITLVFRSKAPAIEPFELVNERTEEKLTLEEEAYSGGWKLKRCKIGETAEVQRKDDIKLKNGVFFFLKGNNCIGPLHPPTKGQSDGKDI